MRLKPAGLPARLRDERGFAMPAALGALMVVLALSAAAIAAAGGDINLSRYDQDDKQAYAAAEAGINDFLARLNRDSNSWASCANVPTPVNQPIVDRAGNPIAASGARKWRDLASSGSRYSIELIPADYSTNPNPQATKCDPANPVASMIYQGNLRIRATGNVNGTANYRSVIGTFRRTGFLDFIYFTDLENQSLAYTKRSGTLTTRATDTAGNLTGGPDLLAWAGDRCDRQLWGAAGEGRDDTRWRGQFLYGGAYAPAGGSYTVSTQGDIRDSSGNLVSLVSLCGEITFATDDKVNGPFHSNDNFRVCGSPDFGRSGRDDRVQTAGDKWIAQCGGSAPDFFPSLRLNASQLDPPPSNGALAQVALPAYRFTGNTTIALNGTSMTVSNPNVNGGAPQVMALPSNGVIDVANNACSAGYNPTTSELRDPACGDVWLSGTYARDLTIAADNDIVVTANVTRTAGTDALLGLIPQGFARVWHPVTDQASSSCANKPESPKNITIDAAILTLKGSFTVDNYWCGSLLGTLTVNGAIAQKHRGVVASGGSSGYVKNYNYDDRLKYRSPPYFLDPVQSAWRILRQSEQSPPARP